MELIELAKGYLEAAGYGVTRRDKDLLVGSRRIEAGATLLIYVWVPNIKDPQGWRSQEGPYMRRFGEINQIAPSAQKFMLVPTVEGTSNEFREGAPKWYGVKIRTPLLFFDTPFIWEELTKETSAAEEREREQKKLERRLRQTASAADALRSRGEQVLRRRAPQPFTVENDGPEGLDLLENLLQCLRFRPKGSKPIHVVVGPAGMGKTLLFEALFARLYGEFLEAKGGQQLSARPIALLPEYLRSAEARTVKALLKAYLETDFVRPLQISVFEWMLTYGFAQCLMDGLDEVIAQDPSFFEYLEQLLGFIRLTGAAGLPAILICVRDSLLATSDEFRDFCVNHPDDVAIYRLGNWRYASKNKCARIALGPKAKDFMTTLRSRPALDELACTPYYCVLLTQLFKSGELGDSYSEADLLREAVIKIIDREYDEKGLLDSSILPKSEALAFLEALAAEDMEQGFIGVPVSEAREWAKLSLPPDLPGAEVKRLVSQMTQLALFSYGGLDQIRFAQEILEQYLLGQWLIRLLDQGLNSFLRPLALRQIPADWITLKVIADHVRCQGKLTDLLTAVYHAMGQPLAFRNALQLAALAAEQGDALREVPFERKDLSGLVFERLDFQGVSFWGCDLSHVEFRECILKDANLEDTIIKNTGFFLSSPEALKGARIGDLARFYSMRVEGGRVISEHTEAQKWFEEKTGTRPKIVEPCPTALQLRHIFGKFIHPNGQARRSWVDIRGVLAGKRYHKDPEAVLRAAIKYGYLDENKAYDRVARPDGESYSELVAYVTTLKLSPGIRALLDDVCGRPGCSHVPEVT